MAYTKVAELDLPRLVAQYRDEHGAGRGEHESGPHRQPGAASLGQPADEETHGHGDHSGQAGVLGQLRRALAEAVAGTQFAGHLDKEGRGAAWVAEMRDKTSDTRH
jgi:hypothetical protein